MGQQSLMSTLSPFTSKHRVLLSMDLITPVTGTKLGLSDGMPVGNPEGELLGEILGTPDGCIETEGDKDGRREGTADGYIDGKSLGTSMDGTDGIWEGASLERKKSGLANHCWVLRLSHVWHLVREMDSLHVMQHWLRLHRM